MAGKRRLEEDYEKICTIGRGSYGVVYRVRRRQSGDIVALKRVRLRCNVSGYEDGIPSSSLREIAALKNLRHPNILHLQDIIHTGANLFLVFEHLDQDLKKALDESRTGLSVKTVQNYMCQLLKAIAFCHSRQVLHRDLKLQNLLVNTRDGTIKLADFGLARGMNIPQRVYTKEVVTLWYRAPELLLGSNTYGTSVDIWSLGCIFFEMLTNMTLFPGDSEIDQLFKIFRILGTPTASDWKEFSTLPHYKSNFPIWPARSFDKLLESRISTSVQDIAHLLSLMLTYDPERRISAREAMQHRFFDEMTTTTTTQLAANRPTLRDIPQNPASNM